MSRSARQPPEMRGEPEDVAFFELMNSHLPRNFARLMRHLPADPRCRLCRESQERRPIRRGRCALSSRFQRARRLTPLRVLWVNRCRSGSDSRSSLKTELAPAAI